MKQAGQLSSVRSSWRHELVVDMTARGHDVNASWTGRERGRGRGLRDPAERLRGNRHKCERGEPVVGTERADPRHGATGE